jgi:hypothetical protein
VDTAADLLARELSRTTETKWRHPHFEREGPIAVVEERSGAGIHVFVSVCYDAAAPHLDFGFALPKQQTPMWDCCAGFVGGSSEEAICSAVETWVTGSATVFVELLTRRGAYADHYYGNDPGGLPGWHTIVGPAVILTGDDPHRGALQGWLAENSMNSPIAGAIEEQLVEGPHTVKIILSNRSGEPEFISVEVDRERNDAAAQILADLDWPRPAELQIVRLFALAVHPESAKPDPQSGMADGDEDSLQ